MCNRMMRCAVVTVGVFVTLGAMAPQSLEAQTLLQRLFPRLAARRALRRASWTAYYPVATWAPPAQQRVVVGYAPQTQFRTVWASVPVTQYRPVTWAIEKPSR